MALEVRRSILFILAALILALALRTLNLGRDFSGDETILVGMAKGSAGQVMQSVREADVYPPLTYLAMHYLMKMSQGEAWLRGYFLLFGIGCCITVYLIALEYLGEEEARTALLLAAFSPLLVFASQYARSYIDSAFWMLLSVLFMLRMLKGGETLLNWCGYVASAALALYTFYFSALLLASQFIFVNIFEFRRPGRLAAWYAAFFAICLIFLPWLPSAIGQFNNASSLAYDWSGKGLDLGNVKVGMYIRNMAAAAGMDPYFMVFKGGLAARFPKMLLIAGAFFALAGLALLAWRSVTALRQRFSGRTDLALFMPFLAFVPILLAWAAAAAVNVMTNAKYLVAFHALFLIVIAAVLGSVSKKMPKTANVLLALLICIFVLRIPSAVASEYDTAGAAAFMKSTLPEGSAVIYARSGPEDMARYRMVGANKYISLNADGSRYTFKSEPSRALLKEEIIKFPKVCLYRVYGNAELFGANALIDGLLKEAGYRPVRTAGFRNIDVVEYEK